MIQPLAIIADLYVPSLLIACLVFVGKDWRKGDKLAALQLFVLAICTYSFMLIDKVLGLWDYFKLDFSTHTAAALAMVVFLFVRTQLIWKFLIGISFLSYCLLMKLLQYHSFLDMFSTGIFMGLFFVGALHLTTKSFKNVN